MSLNDLYFGLEPKHFSLVNQLILEWMGRLGTGTGDF